MRTTKILWGVFLVIVAVLLTKLYISPGILHKLVPQAPVEAIENYFQTKPGVWVRKGFLLVAITLYLLAAKNVVQAVRKQKHVKTGE